MYSIICIEKNIKYRIKIIGVLMIHTEELRDIFSLKISKLLNFVV